MRKPFDWCKRISNISLDKGNKLKGSWRLTKEEGMGCMGERKKEKEEENEVRERLLVLMCARIKHGGNVCKNQAWRKSVQESSIERVCVRIRHERNLCSKYLLQASRLLF